MCRTPAHVCTPPLPRSRSRVARGSCGTWLVWHTWLVWARGSWGVGRVQKMFVDFSKSRARGVCTLLRGETVWE